MNTKSEEPKAVSEKKAKPSPKAKGATGKPPKSAAEKKTGRSSQNIRAKKAESSGSRKVPKAFINDLTNLAQILEKNPGILEPIRDVFEYHLVDPIDRKTFPRIVNAMSMLLGPAPAMVIMTGCHVNSVSFFDDLLGAIPNDDSVMAAVWIIQHLTALYGNRVQKAYSLSSGTMDEDWHTIDINTYKRESESPNWIIDMHLVQYSGTECQIRMTPDSAFQLVDILMVELEKNVPTEEVDADLMDKCRQHCKEYYEKYYGKVKAKAGDDDHPAGYA
ncbi:MAG TPA: hypothetical protein O0X27_00195 [Methanocorpusculum sp.]|nr:hypothetical protein [Methanocorpusculum sp.]